MRISDWSSDVCSSDLAHIEIARDAGRQFQWPQMIEKDERPDHPARVEGQHPPDDETAAQITFALVDDAFDSHVPSGSLVSEIDDPATGIVTARKLFEGILFGPTPDRKSVV